MSTLGPIAIATHRRWTPPIEVLPFPILKPGTGRWDTKGFLVLVTLRRYVDEEWAGDRLDFIEPPCDPWADGRG